MLLDNKFINIVGYSGHGLVVGNAAIERGYNLKFYTEKKEVGFNSNPYNLIYLGHEFDERFNGWKKNIGFLLGVGDNRIRQKCGSYLLEKEEECITLIHAKSIISTTAQIGIGVFVSAGAVVSAFSTIGNFCIINTAAIVEHECILSNAVHIAPGAVLCGNVKVGERSFIGANAVIKQGVVIGDDVIVGAGSVVIKNIPNATVVVGNPADKKLS